MPTVIFKNKYLNYAGSILFGRGLEYVVFLLLALSLNKQEFGDFEVYKKTLEVGGVLLGLGANSIIISYTRKPLQKTYFTLAAIVVSSVLVVLLFPLVWVLGYAVFLLPLLFYAVFFYGQSILQAYNLVAFGSNYTSVYKAICALVLSGLLLVFVLLFDTGATALFYTADLALILGLGYLWYTFDWNTLVWQQFRRYFKFYLRLLLKAITTLADNVVNMAFLLTDLYIIKFHAASATTDDLANYGFCLTLANAMLIVPMTIFQVRIEAIKENLAQVLPLRKKNFQLLAVFSVLVVAAYLVLTHWFLPAYRSLLVVLVLLVVAKFVQGLNTGYGVVVLVKRLYSQNFYISVSALSANVLAGWFLYPVYGVVGLAILSVIVLLIRLGLTAYVAAKSV